MYFEPFVEPSLSLLLGYLLGSIPFGIILTRLSGAGDLRAIGSGSIGATNVLRTGRKGLAAATLILDAGKGAVAVLVVDLLWPGNGALAAIAALVGHMYPVWLRFDGGKGVATMFGIAMAMHWPAGLCYAAIWLAMLGLTRYSSVGGMSAALLTPVAAALLNRFDLALLFLGCGLLIVWKHRSNIERLVSGTEPRVGRKSDG
jgi:glycerol-3-phosphate acyltransferase PlsY